MANVIYPLYKQSLLAGDTNISLTTGNVKLALVDSASYTYSASHQFFSDLSGVIASSANLGTKSVTNGLFDAADSTFTGVSGAQSEFVIIYIDTGVTTTSRLVFFIDSSVTGLPITPNGGNITFAFNAGGIFQL
jgi:hypothetical protein